MSPLLLSLVAAAASVGPAEHPPVRVTETWTKDLLTAADGTLWFATTDGVILRHPDGRWRMLQAELPGKPERLIAAPDGGVWVSSPGGLVGFGPDGARRPGPDGPNQASFAPPLQVMPDGTVWASFSGNDLYFRDLAGTWTHYPQHLDIRSFALGPDGTLHGAGGKGRSFLPPGADRWVTTKDTTNVYLDSLAVGADGGVWERDLKGGLQWFGTEARRLLGQGTVHAVVDTPAGVWMLGTGRVWSVEGEELVEHRLPGDVGGSKALALLVTASQHLWVATERGLVTLASTPFGLRPTQERWWRFDAQEASLAPCPGRPDAVWVATNDGVFALDSAGTVIEAHPRPFGLQVSKYTQVVPSPDGSLWVTRSGGIGKLDLARGGSRAWWGRNGTLAFGQDGAAWFPYLQTLTRLDPVTGEATHLPLRQPARVVDVRPDRVRVLGVSGSFPLTMDWSFATQRWTVIRTMARPVREALFGALGPPLRTADGAAWWPSTTGLVREGLDASWRVLPMPDGAGTLTDAVLVAGVVHVAAEHGVWRLGEGDTLHRLGTLGATGGATLAVCENTLWVGADAALVEVRDGVPVATHPVDARPVACADGALWVWNEGLGRLEADGQVQWQRARLHPGSSTDLRRLIDAPTEGGWAAADQAWIGAPGSMRALDLVTGAQTALGPWGGYGRGAFDRDGALWRSTGASMERWDPATGRMEEVEIGPRALNRSVAWVRLLQSGVIQLGTFRGPWLERAPGASAFVEVPEAEQDMSTTFVEGATRWSARRTGLWRLDGDTWTRVLDSGITLITPARQGTWVGFKGSVPLVRVVGAEVVERLDSVVPGDTALGVLEDRRGRLWVAGDKGVAMRDAAGAWTRDGSPWQNGRGAPCPFPVEVSVTRGWADAEGVVPRGVVTEGTLTAGGLQHFHVERKMFRIPVADWPALRDQWLRTAPYDPEGPWTTAIQWMWEEADGGLRFVAEREEGARVGPAIFALDHDHWRRLPGSPTYPTAYTGVVARAGGGRWLLNQDGGLVEVGPDAEMRQRILGEPRTVALSAEEGAVVVASRTTAAALRGEDWLGQPGRYEVPVALDGGLLLTEPGGLFELHGEGVWRAPMDWVADVVTLGDRACVVGGGVRCLDRATGVWMSHGDGALLDAAAWGDSLWVAGLMGPDGTSGGVVCRGPERWVCVDVPGLARAVLPDAAGGAWVGTTQGLVYLDAAGKVRRTTLTQPVTRLAAGKYALWVGTELDGLWSWDRDRMRGERVVAGSVHALAADGAQAWAWMDDGIRALRE